jgi:hypothetical protein
MKSIFTELPGWGCVTKVGREWGGSGAVFTGICFTRKEV